MEINQDKIAAHKLMLLYLLHHAQTPLSEERLSEICAQLGLMEYFDLKTNLHDLTENQLISAVEQINGRFFSITEIYVTPAAISSRDTDCMESMVSMRALFFSVVATTVSAIL